MSLNKPVISGAAQVGQTLAAPIYRYQWNRFPGGPIPGASASTYLPTPDDIGKTLSLTVASFVGPTMTSYDVSAATSAVTAVSGGILDFSQASNSALIGALAA
jgi:hypothetical protein